MFVFCGYPGIRIIPLPSMLNRQMEQLFCNTIADLMADSITQRKIDRHKRLAEVEVRLFEESQQMKLGLEVKAKVSGEEYERMLETA